MGILLLVSAVFGKTYVIVLKNVTLGGGAAYLLSDPVVPGLIPSVPKVAEVNQRRWLEERG